MNKSLKFKSDCNRIKIYLSINNHKFFVIEELENKFKDLQIYEIKKVLDFLIKKNEVISWVRGGVEGYHIMKYKGARLNEIRYNLLRELVYFFECNEKKPYSMSDIMEGCSKDTYSYNLFIKVINILYDFDYIEIIFLERNKKRYLWVAK